MFHRNRLFILPLIFIPLSTADSRPVPDQVSWVGRFDEARKQAAAENKFIVIDVSATRSAPCRKMERDVFPDPAFVEFSRDNIFMLLQSDRDTEGASIARRFNVREFPTFLVLNSQGQEVGRLLGGRSAKKLISDLEKIFAHYPNPARKEKQDQKSVEAPPKAPEPLPPSSPPVRKKVTAPETKQGDKDPSVQPAPPKPADNDDPIARLEKRLASATDDSERDWLNLMLGMAHFQAQHWKEAQIYLSKVLEKHPENSSAREMMRIVEKYLRP